MPQDQEEQGNSGVIVTKWHSLFHLKLNAEMIFIFLWLFTLRLSKLFDFLKVRSIKPSQMHSFECQSMEDECQSMEDGFQEAVSVCLSTQVLGL